MTKTLIKTKYYIGWAHNEDLSDFHPVYGADTPEEVEEAKNKLKAEDMEDIKVIANETYLIGE